LPQPAPDSCQLNANRQQFRSEIIAAQRGARRVCQSCPAGSTKLAVVALAALGVVYGDIGTSPLYALRSCFAGESAVLPSHDNVLGILSLIFWALILIVSVKYLVFVLRADNRGEGGILALMALAFPEREKDTSPRTKWVLVACGLFGAALLYGDGLITPAISVLGAMEGLEVAAPNLKPYVVPLTVVILVGLFSVQRIGTGGVSAACSAGSCCCGSPRSPSSESKRSSPHPKC
jgi:KUP system potassium uptake protein